MTGRKPVQRKEHEMTDNTADYGSALLNHIPQTMEATRLVLSTTASMGIEKPPPGLIQEADKHIHELIRQTKALALAVIGLEDRLEHLEGRPGLPHQTLMAIASEFGR